MNKRIDFKRQLRFFFFFMSLLEMALSYLYSSLLINDKQLFQMKTDQLAQLKESFVERNS